MSRGDDTDLKRLLNEIVDSESDEELLDTLRKVYIQNVIPAEVAAADAVPVPLNILLNKNGSERKVNREDYSRRNKAPKPGNPWEICAYLRLLKHPDTSDPTSRKGKEFRAKFRVPLPIFEKIVFKLRDTGEKVFNYNLNTIGGECSIPLELKTLGSS
jgi:hypothetical protein